MPTPLSKRVFHFPSHQVVAYWIVEEYDQKDWPYLIDGNKPTESNSTKQTKTGGASPFTEDRTKQKIQSSVTHSESGTQIHMQ